MIARLLVVRFWRVRVLHVPRQKHVAVPVLTIQKLSIDVSRSVGLLIGAIA